MSSVSRNLRRMAHDVAELPGIRWLTKPLYASMFRRDVLRGNSYFGVYESYAQALAGAPKTRATSFDVPQSGDLYLDHHDSVRVSDYPMIYWLNRLLPAGMTSLFDLGGNIGTTYYGFQRYIDYPDGLRWKVHDVPAVLEAGRQWAGRNDPAGKLVFVDSPHEADGCDMLYCSGVLQYLDFDLPSLLSGMQAPPPHILINLTPMHPTRSFVTLQRVTRQGRGIANCPYSVASVEQFIAAFEALGYRVVDHWQSFERYMRIPFEPELSIDSYHGFYLLRV